MSNVVVNLSNNVKSGCVIDRQLGFTMAICSPKSPPIEEELLTIAYESHILHVGGVGRSGKVAVPLLDLYESQIISDCGMGTRD